MLDKIMSLLLKQEKDIIYERLLREKAVRRQLSFLVYGVVVLFLSLLVVVFVNTQKDFHSKPDTYMVNLEERKRKQIITMPVPHQTFKSVSNWINTALIESYSFDFTNYDERVRNARKNFTSVGYKTYRNALENNNIRDRVMDNRLQVSIIPNGTPILINRGSMGGVNFWRFNIPVLVSFYSGGDPSVVKSRVDLLVLGVPAHVNHRGLAISEFNMTRF